MAKPNPTSNIVSFPGSGVEDETMRSDTNSPETGADNADFGSLGDDWPTLSPGERTQRLFAARAGGDQTVPIGHLFLAARQAQGLSVHEVAASLKFDVTVITAIETMDLSEMPRGFRAPRILTYARALHLPAEDVLTLYRAESRFLDDTKVRPELQAKKVDSDKLKRPTWALPAAIAAGLGLCLVGLMALTSGSEGSESAQNAPADERVTRTELPPFDSAAAAMQGDYTALPLTLVAVRKGWIEVRGANGTLFRDREMRANEVYFPRIGAGWTVSARDGGAFEWRVGDVVVAPLGTDDVSVYAESVDLVARRAMKSVAPTLAASDAISPRH